ncbi:MAG: FAD-dependent oxidoreductase, partial [Candidatus Binataceae bacterium]
MQKFSGADMKTCDFAVIGAGIAGASAAYELALHAAVVLLEREPVPGYHTTGRSAAMFTEHYGNSIIRRLTVASRPFLENPPEGFTATPLVTPRGSILIAREDQLGTLREMLAEIQTYTPSIRAADGGEARRLCPALRADYVAGAIMEPGAMDMDVNAIHQGFLAGLRRRKGEVVTQAEATRLARAGTGWEVSTAQGAWSAGVVVN